MTPPRQKKESDIQREILDMLAKRTDVFFWRQNNIPVWGRSNDGVERFRSLPKYTPKGLPDIFLLYRNWFIAWEVKCPEGTVTPFQLEFGDSFVQFGGRYNIVTSVKDAEDILESYT